MIRSPACCCVFDFFLIKLYAEQRCAGNRIVFGIEERSEYAENSRNRESGF